MRRRLTEAPGITDPAELTKRTAQRRAQLPDGVHAGDGPIRPPLTASPESALARAPPSFRSRRECKGKSDDRSSPAVGSRGPRRDPSEIYQR